MGAEQFHGNAPEVTPEKQELTAERAELERKVEAGYEKRAEQAKVENGERSEEQSRVEALKQAVSVERGSAEKQRKEPAAAPRTRHGVVSKKEKAASYKQHISQIQAELPPAKRAFSKLIHAPVVEKTSEVLGNTVVRPNAMLSGAVLAFVLVLAVYLIAKYYGYVLSGFETIGAFIVGYVIGVIYDFLRVMITGKKA